MEQQHITCCDRKRHLCAGETHSCDLLIQTHIPRPFQQESSPPESDYLSAAGISVLAVNDALKSLLSVECQLVSLVVFSLTLKLQVTSAVCSASHMLDSVTNSILENG